MNMASLLFIIIFLVGIYFYSFLLSFFYADDIHKETMVFCYLQRKTGDEICSITHDTCTDRYYEEKLNYFIEHFHRETFKKLCVTIRLSVNK
jgi:hypothetical protein